MTGATPEIAKIIGFPVPVGERVSSNPPKEHMTLKDWPWDPELGKPHGFDPGAIEQNVNDLARHKDASPAAITLAKAISLIDGERNSQHGERHKNFGHAAKIISAYIEKEITPAQLCWIMVIVKMSRDFNGARNIDNSIDACGYAALAGELAETSDNGC